MANITLYRGDDLLNGLSQAQVDNLLNGAYFTDVSATLIGVRMASGQGYYHGSFFQTSGGNVGGTLNQIDAFDLSGNLTGTAQNLNADVQTMANLNVNQAYSYLLRDSDFINGSFEGDTLGGFTGSDTIWGNGGNDIIFGGSGTFAPIDGDDFLAGGAGADFLYGNGGNDLIVTGQDSLGADDAVNIAFGGKGSDYLYGSQFGDTLFGGGSGYDPLDQPDVIYANAGNDEIYGNGGGDYLFGMNGADTIYGGFGDDIITGGEGNDVMVGGDGSDTYWFSLSEAGLDVIGDFSSTDRVVIVGSGLTSYSQLLQYMRDTEFGATITSIDGTVGCLLYGVSIQSLTGAEFSFIN